MPLLRLCVACMPTKEDRGPKSVIENSLETSTFAWVISNGVPTIGMLSIYSAITNNWLDISSLMYIFGYDNNLE